MVCSFIGFDKYVMSIFVACGASSKCWMTITYATTAMLRLCKRIGCLPIHQRRVKCPTVLASIPRILALRFATKPSCRLTVLSVLALQSLHLWQESDNLTHG